ncbi:unnamed protein product [Camellia sinensis]
MLSRVLGLLEFSATRCFTQEIRLFFLYFGEVVLHDADPSRRTFIHSCLSRSEKSFLSVLPALMSLGLFVHLISISL